MSNLGNLAQSFSYNEQGQLVETSRSYFDDNNDSVSMATWDLAQLNASRTATNDNLLWGKQTSNTYQSNGQLGNTLEYFNAGLTKSVTAEDREGITITRTFDLTDSVQRVKTYGYNQDGQMSNNSEYGWKVGQLDEELKQITINTGIDIGGGGGIRFQSDFNAGVDKIYNEGQKLSTVSQSYGEVIGGEKTELQSKAHFSIGKDFYP